MNIGDYGIFEEAIHTQILRSNVTLTPTLTPNTDILYIIHCIYTVNNVFLLNNSIIYFNFKKKTNIYS